MNYVLLLRFTSNSGWYLLASVYLWGVVVSVWPTHRPGGGDGTGLTVSIRRPESRLLQSAGQRTHKHFSLASPAETATAVLIQSTDTAAATWTCSKQPRSVLSECISLSLNSRQPYRTGPQTSFIIITVADRETLPWPAQATDCNWFVLCKCALTEKIFDYVSVFRDLSQFLPRGGTHSPVFELLAVDAYSSLVALGDTHLVSAALNLLTGVLGGVYIWERNRKWDVYCGILTASLLTLFLDPSLPIIPLFTSSHKSQISLLYLLVVTWESAQIIGAALNCLALQQINSLNTKIKSHAFEQDKVDSFVSYEAELIFYMQAAYFISNFWALYE